MHHHALTVLQVTIAWRVRLRPSSALQVTLVLRRRTLPVVLPAPSVVTSLRREELSASNARLASIVIK